MKTFPIILITAILSGGGVWLLKDKNPTSAQAGGHQEREALYYQSAMHPWIKSDKPGRCTICGMELTPVYAGEQGFDTIGGENTIALTRDQIRITGIQTTKAAKAPLVRSLQVAGMIDDDATRHRVISAYVDGRIEKLHVNYQGAEVSKGQPLAEIYSPALLQAEREYRQLPGDLRDAAGSRLRQLGLTADQISGLAMKTPETLHSGILSPLGGTVVAQDVYEGQYVTTGQKLFEIADFSTMWFQFLAYEADLPWLGIGQQVEVGTPSLPGRRFEGKITFIDPNLDKTTRSTKIRVELPNPEVNGRRELLHKLYAEGLVRLDAPETLTIPRTAVIQTGADAVVYVDLGNGVYAQSHVKTGRKGDSLVEILSGLKEGDSVVTQGNLLIDGQAELNRSHASGPQEPAPPARDLTTEQQAAIRDFIDLADSMSANLAADDLAAFNKSAGSAMISTNALVKSLENSGLPADQLAALAVTGHFQEIGTIESARASFLAFSMNATALLDPLRKSPGFPPMKIWQCPMVNQSVPGALAKGRWIQSGTRPIANPYFGSGMLDCGEEIKP